MTSTYTSDLRLNKQGVGDNNNTWGTVVNTQLDLLDDSISGMVTVNVTTGSNVTLSTANGTSDEARKMILKLSGTPIANINIIVPAVSKVYVIEGGSFAGNFTVTIKPTSGTGVAFSAGECGVVACDGTNMLEIVKKSDSTPTGEIKMYSGSIASALVAYPGWAFCDGTNGTPDLRDKFVIAARQDDSGVAKTNVTGSLTQSGGSITSSADGDHNHGGTTGSTTLTINQIPAHTHPMRTALVPTGSQTGRVADGGASDVQTGSAGGGLGHDHTISASGTHTHTATPPYYALVFIMKL